MFSLTTDEEGAELVSDGLGVGNVPHPHVVGHGGVGLSGGNVLDKADAELTSHEQPNNVLNVSNSSVLPGLPNDFLRNPWGPFNHEAVLETLVLQEVGHLGVDGNLVVHNLVEAAMVLFESNDSIRKDSVGLAVQDGELLNAGGKPLDDGLSPIKEAENELETSIRGKVNAPLIKVGSGKAWQEMQVVGLVGVHDHREEEQDLREALSVPKWTKSVHGRCHQVVTRGVLVAFSLQGRTNLLEREN